MPEIIAAIAAVLSIVDSVLSIIERVRVYFANKKG
jgi:hypothetical protein